MASEERANKPFYLSVFLRPGKSPEAPQRLHVRVGLTSWAGVDDAAGRENRLHEWTFSHAHAPAPDARTVDVVVIAPQCRVEPLSARLPWPPGEEQFREFFLTLFPEEVGKRDSLWVRVELLTRNREVESVQEEFALSVG
ncbi:MAG: hypothetical protein E6G97_18220 [Alphaproteobacteria bacterium]|nr:MAG: hypothetical protein E6G97_18220 [Alphaproteobacteria bacterium]